MAGLSFTVLRVRMSATFRLHVCCLSTHQCLISVASDVIPSSTYATLKLVSMRDGLEFKQHCIEDVLVALDAVDALQLNRYFLCLVQLR